MSTHYEIAGAVDSAYFARAERLALLLRSALGLSESEVVVTPIASSEWPATLDKLGKRFGFQSLAAGQLSINAGVDDTVKRLPNGKQVNFPFCTQHGG